MHIHIIAVGRCKAGPERDLFEHFGGRITPPPILKEVREKRSLPPQEIMESEGDYLLAAIPKGAIVVALDEKGRTLSSSSLAAKMGQWRDDGIRDLAFIIGGAGGLGKKVINRADLVLSLGLMTWPHLLVRGMLAEQIYRSQCILSGHPYHRE